MQGIDTNKIKNNGDSLLTSDQKIKLKFILIYPC